MLVSFVDAEEHEREYFAEELRGFELEFVEEAKEVSPAAEIVCIFIYTQIDTDFLARHRSLRLIAARSTTVDHIDLAECAQRGVEVRSVGSYGDHTVAEHTFALLLAVARRLREIMTSQRAGFSWERFRGFELRDKTLGVIGVGRIGRQVIPIARAFGMRVLSYDPNVIGPEQQDDDIKPAPFEELLAQSDIISLHAPLTPTTHHLLNSHTLALCRPGVVIINTARGALIDTAALIHALDSGIVSAVGLDVLEEERVLHHPAERIVGQQIIDRLHSRYSSNEPRDPRRIQQLAQLMRSDALLAHDHVVFTPHVGFNTVEAVQRINEKTVENIRNFASVGKASTVSG